jgi:plasmid stabilization system protein ParE
MPRAVIRFAQSAVTDLEAVKAWHAEQGNAEVGERVVLEIIERIGVLAEHPEIGRVVPEFRQSFLRELVRPPFRIVYRREPKHVRIVRVWRGNRPLVLPKDQTSE